MQQVQSALIKEKRLIMPDAQKRKGKPTQKTSQKTTKQQSRRPAPKQEAKPAKRRKMNWKERLGIAVIILGALALIVVMALHIKIIPAELTDSKGNKYQGHISLMEKFRGWRPFIDLEGDLDSKEYSYKPAEQSRAEDSGVFDDGLDLDQIREGQFSVLFLGTDESRSNTDVMMLIMFDIAKNDIHILQIPRDSFVPDFTSFEAGKINSVYSLGDPDKSQVQRVVDCIEETFAIPIDRYVTTSCTDIVEIVDLLGGIPINMPYTINYEPGKTIYAGEQVLTGQQSEWMVRVRHAYNEGDIGRMKAQRLFLAAAMARVCDIGTIELMGYVDKIVDNKLMGSNLSMDEISKLSDFATTIGMDKITMHMLPGEGYNYYPPQPSQYPYYSVWSIHKGPTLRLINAYFRPYYQELDDLPLITELVTEGSYVNTLYDDDSVDFQQIEDGGTFNGR